MVIGEMINGIHDSRYFRKRIENHFRYKITVQPAVSLSFLVFGGLAIKQHYYSKVEHFKNDQDCVLTSSTGQTPLKFKFNFFSSSVPFSPLTPLLSFSYLFFFH